MASVHVCVCTYAHPHVGIYTPAPPYTHTKGRSFLRVSIGKGHGWDVVLHTLCFHLTGRRVGSLFSWCFWEDLKVVLSIFIVCVRVLRLCTVCTQCLARP